MALLRKLHSFRTLYRTDAYLESSYLYGSWRSYSSVDKFDQWSSTFYSHEAHNGHPCTCGSKITLQTAMNSDSLNCLNGKRSLSTQASASPQQKMGALKVSMTSPGIIYEPYAPREPVSFWKRWFTKSGWRRTKEDIKVELSSAYAISKLRKTGYSKKKFYSEAVEMYKQINLLIATGDKTPLRKAVTEKLYSGLKNEIKARETMWSSVYWELVEPIIKIRTLRARLIGVDKSDYSKVFIQLTIEFLAKQKFEAYDANGATVAGDKNKEILVRDIWIFEKSLFHTGAYWRLCGRINLGSTTK